MHRNLEENPFQLHDFHYDGLRKLLMPGSEITDGSLMANLAKTQKERHQLFAQLQDFIGKSVFVIYKDGNDSIKNNYQNCNLGAGFLKQVTFDSNDMEFGGKDQKGGLPVSLYHVLDIIYVSNLKKQIAEQNNTQLLMFHFYNHKSHDYIVHTDLASAVLSTMGKTGYVGYAPPLKFVGVQEIKPGMSICYSNH